MPKPGEIRYCPELGGKATNAAFVWIPPGSFWMGDKRDKRNPVRFITLTKGFWMQQAPLIERQYNGKDSDLPTTYISWDEIVDFCQGKLLRMPTEAEWEYVARANTGHKYLYAGSNVANNVAWTDTNSSRQLHKVGQLKSNDFGLFDVSGLVYEWCADEYDNAPLTVPQINPTGPAFEAHRGNRGGCWSNNQQNAQVAHRAYADSSAIISGNSVRLIWEPQHA